MKAFRIIAVAGVLALAFSAIAQGGGGQGRQGQFGRAGGPRLLLNEAVQKELKMTADQVTKAQGAFANAPGGGGGGGGAGGGGGQLSAEEREKRRVDQESKVKEILDVKQFERYGQLILQSSGPSILAQKWVGDKLGITADQATKIQAIQQEQRQAQRDAFGGGGGGGGGGGAVDREAMQKLRDTYSAKVIALLTEEQKKSWQSMLGEPFKFN